MNLNASIDVKGDAGSLYKCFMPEIDAMKHDRASFRLSKKNKGVVFDISAKDSVALRALLNTITKLLTVYEKTERI